MTDLAEFLLARITEDEDRAGLATQLGTRWQPGGPGVWAEATTVLASDGTLPRSGRSVAEVDDVAVPHVLAWDPARVLAECDAKRRIVEACTWPRSDRVQVRQGVYEYRTTLAVSHDDATAELVLTALALPYADHPDYDESCRP